MNPQPDAALGSGCDAPAYALGTTAASLLHAGASRSFIVHVPPGYQSGTPHPLVLMFHGGGGSGRQFQASARFDAIADREGVIAVYPDGSGALRTWNGGGCCGFAVQNDVDDVGFTRALLDHLEASLCVDARRVYASGMSNGGIFAHRLGCELADRIAAIAPVAGTHMTDRCEPARPMPVLHIHGSDDGHVPWDGGMGCGLAGVLFSSVLHDTVIGWRARNRCNPPLGELDLPGVDFTGVDCMTTPVCPDDAEVALCEVLGGGHNWPGGRPPAGLIECPADGIQSTTFLASEAIWRFFTRHAVPE